MTQKPYQSGQDSTPAPFTKLNITPLSLTPPPLRSFHSAPVKHTNSGVYNILQSPQNTFMPQFSPQQQRMMDYNNAINNIKISLTELQHNLSKTYSNDKFAS